jgi:hypothetical protein
MIIGMALTDRHWHATFVRRSVGEQVDVQLIHVKKFRRTRIYWKPFASDQAPDCAELHVGFE